MRGLAWLVLAAAMLSFAPAARATVLTQCASGCLTDQSGSLLLDYTVPTDGQEYRWDLYSDASHPTAMITLASPNDTYSMASISNGNGATSPDPSYPFPDFKWNEVVNPGHTEITLWAPADFNVCAGNPPAGTVCSVANSVFGDSVYLTTGVNDKVTITFASTAIPEPATWSLLVGGFLALGWALRRQRTVLRSA